MSERLVNSKGPYRCSLSKARKIYGALDLIENRRTNFTSKRKSCYQHNRKNSRVRKGSDSNRLRTPGNMKNSALQQIPPEELLDERQKTRLSQLLSVYGEQHSPAYRKGFDIKNFQHRPHFPDLVKATMTIGSLLRSSSQVSGLQERTNSGSVTQTLTLPDLNQVKKT